MKIWSRFPVFRFLIPFSAGILSCIANSFSVSHIVYPAIAGFLLAWLFTARNYATGRYALRWLAGIPFYLCFFCSGYIFTWMNQSKNFSSHFSELPLKDYFIAEIIENPRITPKGHRLNVKVVMAFTRNGWEGCRGNIMLTVKDTLKSIQPGYGDVLIVNALINNVDAVVNPGGFDYAKYLESKNIRHNAFADVKNTRLLKKGSPSGLFVIAANFRDLMLEKLLRYVEGKDELGVAGALLLGYEEWLDEDLESSYTAAGVLHVLCVSGMHVGLIYVILAWCLGFMEKKKWLRHLRYILLLLLIWFYAMVTGFSPSVIRASAMITFIIAGRWLNRNANVYNILCSSCFLMFLVNPYLIVSAGFQLSFLAVCGIIFLHRLILPLYVAPNRIIHLTWELVSVSLSAQLATLPLSIYYFHQFPNYFLIGNLVIIPLSTLVMYSGLLLLVTDWIPYCGIIFGTITGYGITWLNEIVLFVGRLPGAVTEGLFISMTEMILLYCLLLFITLWLVFKHRELLMVTLLIMIAFLSSRIFYVYTTKQQDIFTVYHVKGKSLASVIRGNKAIMLSSENDTGKYALRTVAAHLTAVNASLEKIIVQPENSILQLSRESGTMLLIKDWKKNYKLPQHLSQHPSTVIIGGNISIDPAIIATQINSENIISDGSVRPWQLKKLKQQFHDRLTDINTNGPLHVSQ